MLLGEQFLTFQRSTAP